MPDATPGQAAYEAHAAMVVPRPWRWDQLDGKLRAAWEAAAQAVLNDAFPGLKRQLAEARADRSHLQAQATALAGALRKADAELQEIHDALTAAWPGKELTEDTGALLVAALVAERDAARAVVRDMLLAVTEYAGNEQDNDLIAQWTKRAGLDAP
jgi:hypothetical protein